jgi:RNA polymerase sigma-70 factor (ECF subfamily)
MSPPRHATPTGGSREFVARLKAARDGARTPRGELLQRCRGYLLAVAQRRLPPDLRAKVGASDLAQEALTKAHANFERFTGESERELLAWLSRILEYSLYTVERRFRGTNKRNVAREVPLEGNSDSAGVPLNLAGDSPSPDSAAAAREEQLRLVAKLAQLRPADHEIIELRNLQALSFAEIARRQGRDPDTVRKHWARALDRLSDALDD